MKREVVKSFAAAMQNFRETLSDLRDVVEHEKELIEALEVEKAQIDNQIETAAKEMKSCENAINSTLMVYSPVLRTDCPCCFKNWGIRVAVEKSVILNKVLFYRCHKCGSITPKPLLKGDSMAKKVIKSELPTVDLKTAVICQCCKFHCNKPSTCSALSKAVGRKQDASKCEKFVRTK